MDQLLHANYFPWNFIQYLIYQTECHGNSGFFFKFHGKGFLLKYVEKLHKIPWKIALWNSMGKKILTHCVENEHFTPPIPRPLLSAHLVIL